MREEIVRIVQWDVANAGDLAQTYSEQVAGVPHCYPVSPDEFEAGFPFPYHKYTFRDYSEDIHSEKLIVGEQNGRIIGFADIALAEIVEKGRREYRGFIRFFTYQPGYRSVGQAILEEAEKSLRDSGMDQISAFRLNFRNDHCGYRFYHVGYGMVSDRLGHICTLLYMNGYKPNGGEIFLNQPNYSVAEPVLPDGRVEIAVEEEAPENALLPGLSVKAFRSGKEIGFCESTSVGEFCRADKAQDWVFVSGLDVVESEQGKGMGRYLLQRNLWEMRKIRYKNTVISNDWRNYRALLFYANYGYRLADTNYEFVKKI
jgi:GNAT superfamily N-acetyltransferase